MSKDQQKPCSIEPSHAEYREDVRRRQRGLDWRNGTALVTGAGAGIGEAVALGLCNKGLRVVAVDKNHDGLEKMASKLDEDSRERLSVRMCDLGRKEDISELFNFIESTMGRLDVCVNCAGFSHYTTLTDGDAEQWEQMLDVNVLAVAVCSKEAIGLMRKHGDNSGHIVNISSNLAHYGPPSDHNYLRFYSCTKFALKSFNEGLRQELRDQKSSIRISSISPGLVRTEFMDSVLKTHPEKLENYYDQYPALEPSDVADAVIYALSTPRHVEINEIVMYSTEKIADYSD